MTYISIRAKQWLQPLNSLPPNERRAFRDSCMFGIYLVDGSHSTRLAGFGYGMNHFIRSYLSATRLGAFYSDLHFKYKKLIPDMPLSRYEQDIHIAENYISLTEDSIRFSDENELFDDELKKHLQYLKSVFAASAELRSVCKIVSAHKELVSKIGGEIISCEIFSRMRLNSEAEGFGDCVDPTLSFAKDGRGELSFFPVGYWDQPTRNKLVEPWCLKFDMNTFRASLETCLQYFCKEMLCLGDEISDELRDEYRTFTERLYFADKSSGEEIRVQVDVQPEYSFQESHWL